MPGPNLLQLAQDDRAASLRNELLAFEGGPPNAGTAYGFAAGLARYQLERGRWSEAAALSPHPQTFPWGQFPEAEAVTEFARGLGTARSGRTGDARLAAARLGELSDRLTNSAQIYWAEQVDIQRQVVLAWADLAEGRSSEGLDVLRTAAEREEATDKHIQIPGPLAPARELLGEMLLQLDQPAAALVALEASLLLEPKRFRGLYLAARAAHLAGDPARAGAYYGQLLELARNAEGSRPELQEAREFVQSS